METKVQENKVRQMEFPFPKAHCLVSITHTRVPWPQSSFG